MRIKRCIFAAIIIAVAATVALIWFARKHAEVPSSTAPETTTKPSPRVVTGPHQPTAGTTGGTNGVAVRKAEGANRPSEPVLNEMRAGLTALNDVPIVFYGRLEDQFGSPVVGADIKGGTTIYNGSGSGSSRISTTSDANGLFELKAGNGESLGIVPHKNGYVLATTETFFRYSYMYPDHFTPDANSPKVIKMWKLQGAEPLFNINQKHRIHYTTEPIYCDLLAGSIVPSGGDLKITVDRPSGVVSEHNPQDWGFKIEAVGGGLIETSSQEASVSYAAPENGYKASNTLTASNNHHGIGVIQSEFFIQSRNGQVYSKLGVSFGINDTENGLMYIIFDGVANTNSSRNWEGTAPAQ